MGDAIAAAEKALAAAKIAGMQAEDALTAALLAVNDNGKEAVAAENIADQNASNMYGDDCTKEVDDDSDSRLLDENENFAMLSKTSSASIVDVDDDASSDDDGSESPSDVDYQSESSSDVNDESESSSYVDDESKSEEETALEDVKKEVEVLKGRRKLPFMILKIRSNILNILKVTVHPHDTIYNIM